MLCSLARFLSPSVRHRINPMSILDALNDCGASSRNGATE